MVRYIVCDTELQGVAKFLMVNIYGPNIYTAESFKNIFSFRKKSRNWILVGDWNLVLAPNQSLDTRNYPDTNSLNSAKEVKSLN